MSPYAKDIIEILGCAPEDAVMVEDIMRNEVFHSTLDWQTEAEFRKGAREAFSLLNENREDYEEYYRQAREAFERMRT